MKCDDAMGRTSGRALGELDPGEHGDLERHLATCAACREAATRADLVVKALASDGGFEESPSRRERTVAAMVAAHATAAPRITRRRWLAASVAAGVLAVLAVPFLIPRGGLTVERLDGTASIHRAGAPGDVALREGDRVGPGDLVKSESSLVLEGRHRLRVVVNKDSHVRYDVSGEATRLTLERGAVRIESPEMDITIVDPRKERRAVVRGTTDVRFSAVLGIPNKPVEKFEFRIHVRKGSALLESPKERRRIDEGLAVIVTEEGNIQPDDKPAEPPGDPGRKQS